ncbi:MAG: cytochrome-c peroxidase [Paracoccaceae bacterium]
MQGKIFGLALTFVAATTARADVLRDAAAYLFAPLPSTVPAVHDNRVTPAKIALGKALFFDPRLSASGVFSCSSCHNLATGGDDNLETSIGHGWQKGPRNTPTVLNAVLNEAQFWDGRAEDLKAQVKVPMTPARKCRIRPRTSSALKSMPAYGPMVQCAFPEEPVNFDNMAKALEAFEATLITPAPFDSWLNGDDAAMSTMRRPD